MGYTYILIGDYDQLHNFVKILHGKTEELYNLHYHTQLKVEALKQEWFGDGANAFFEIMENHLLPALVKVIEALTATQDRIREVMRTINNADEETRVYFSTDALTADLFANRLFLETLSPAAQKAGVTSLVGAATSAAAGTTASDQSAAATENKKGSSHDGIKAHHKSGPEHTPEKPPEKHEGKIRSQSPRSGEMSGLEKMGSSLKSDLKPNALVGGAGNAPVAPLESGSAGSGGGASGGAGAPAGDAGGSDTPSPESGLAGGAGLGAGAAAAAAALGAAAKVLKDDQEKE